MRVGFLTRYAGKGASSRVRAMQFAPALKQEAIESTFLPLLSDEYIARLYKGSRSLWETARGYTQRTGQMVAGGSFDLLWIEKELFPYLPAWIETAMLGNRCFVLDLDDAIFHNYDLARSPIVRALLGRRRAMLTSGQFDRAIVALNQIVGKTAHEFVQHHPALGRRPDAPGAGCFEHPLRGQAG